MPKLNGSEVQRRIAEQNRPLAIVFLSGRGTVPTVAEAMKLGAVDFLEKPVEAEDLHRVITRSLQMVQIEEAEYA